MTYVYESPDGGETVFRRRIGGGDREQISGLTPDQVRARMQENQLWHKIRQAADQDLELRDMLDQIKLYYQLKSQP